MNKTPPLVFIEWDDASGSDGWIRAEKLIESDDKLARIKTVGYLVHEDKDSITLTMAHDTTNNNFGAFMSVPKSCIRKRKKIAQ